MKDHRNDEIERLRKKVRKLESALRIVARHSGKTEHRMKEQFGVVAETIPVPMMITSAGGDVVFANPNASKTFGYSFETFTSLDARSLYGDPGDRKKFLREFTEKGEVSGFRVELRKSDGTLFPAVLFSRGIYFDGQEGILTIMHDLTEVMTLEKQLRHTQKMEAIGTLASGIAHDFNNILAAIFGYTELAIHQMGPARDSKREYLDNVLKAAIRAKSMIMQMMDFCRRPEQEKKPFPIGTVIAEVVKMIKSLTPSNIVVRADIRDKDLTVLGDPTQVHQVMTNLMTNSVHALSDKGGVIEVSLEKVVLSGNPMEEPVVPDIEAGTYARVMVRDNGPGIPRNIVHRIFDPFFTTKPAGQGTGMGLAVVHGILRAHKGAVTVESEPGKMTLFSCYFPVSGENGETAGQDIVHGLPEKGDERILLVDDDPMVADLCGQMLRRMGYIVTACAEGGKALEVFQDHPGEFDLVITDNIMPEMSGTELAGKILRIRPGIPVILITGTPLVGESDAARAGIQEIVHKPFERREIHAAIRRVLNPEKIPAEPGR